MQGLLAQLAQRGGAGGGAGGGNAAPFGDKEFLMVFIVVAVIFFVIALVIEIFFLLTLSRALSRCSPENRTMEPGMVWLNLVPCLNLVWQFITVNRIAESLSNEFYARRMDRSGEDYGKSLGTTACVLNLLGIIPYVGALFSLGGIVCGIIYWVKIAGYSRELAESGDSGDDYDRDDDYDDRPRKKKRRDDYDDYDDDYDRR
jgi:hypothetical protein